MPLESRITEAKSAIEEAAMVSWPSDVDTSPASLRTGTTSPSEVAHRVMARNTGLWITPAVWRPSPNTRPRLSEAAKPMRDMVRNLPFSRAGSISRPARNSSMARPSRARIWMGMSSRAQPSTEGPMTMPATISSTTEGRRSRGASPRSKGAAKAMAPTSIRPVNETSGIVVVPTVRRLPAGPARPRSPWGTKAPRATTHQAATCRLPP